MHEVHSVVAVEHHQPLSSGSSVVDYAGQLLQAESFWATIKVGFLDRYLWPTKATAKLAVGDWIERVYNRRRRHSAIGMISPADYENRHTQTAQAALPRVYQTGSSPSFVKCPIGSVFRILLFVQRGRQSLSSFPAPTANCFASTTAGS